MCVSEFFRLLLMSPRYWWLFLITLAVCPMGFSADPPAPGESYADVVSKIYTPENISDFMAKADALIDRGEAVEAEMGVGRNVVRADTKGGLHLEFALIRAPEAIMYYAAISRNGDLLKYPEATTMLALLGERAGLTHPIAITEGEKPVFYAQWLIKPTEWKALRKKMLEVRTTNRAIVDPVKALKLAIGREVDARAAAKAH